MLVSGACECVLGVCVLVSVCACERYVCVALCTCQLRVRVIGGYVVFSVFLCVVCMCLVCMCV